MDWLCPAIGLNFLGGRVNIIKIKSIWLIIQHPCLHKHQIYHRCLFLPFLGEEENPNKADPLVCLVDLVDFAGLVLKIM